MNQFFVVAVCAFLIGCADTSVLSSSSQDRSVFTTSEGIEDYEAVHSVQLHPVGLETGLPIVIQNGANQLRLAFDLVEEPARPLSIFFYHANREWERDLSAGEFMDSFQYEDVLDYRPSLGTIIPYVHYEYAFPSRSISFKISGNYVLQVSEQGRDDQVLFERRFFVSEQALPLEMTVDEVMVAGSRGNAIQPYVRFNPNRFSSNAFDFTACFVRNGELDAIKCEEQASMDVLPNMVFYLQPEQAFRPKAANYFLDLTDLRVGYRIERVNRQDEPWLIQIEPDNARFPGSQLAPSLFGNSVLRSSNTYLTEPDIRAEYVNAQLTIQPSDRNPIGEAVFLQGSFSNWRPIELRADQWNADVGGYQISVLLKQGHHEYTFTSSNSLFKRSMELGLPQLANRYYSFVYFRDTFSQTDRLLAVKGMDTN